MTSDLYSLIFVGKLIALSWPSVPWPVWSLLPLMVFHNWFVWILSIWTGPLLPTPSIHPTSADGPGLMPPTSIVPLSESISTPQSAALLSSLQVNCRNSSPLSHRRSISSANYKLQSGCPPMDTDDSEVSTSCSSFSELSANWPFCACCRRVNVIRLCCKE